MGTRLWIFRLGGCLASGGGHLALSISPWWALGLGHFALVGSWHWVFGSNFFFEIEVNFYNPVNGVTKLVFNDFWVMIFQPPICKCYI